jgi:hypothetical protein
MKLKVGDVVEVVGLIDLNPHTVIQPGERGTVVFSDGEGNADIKLDKHHQGLCEWFNCFWLIPPFTDEVAKAIRLITKAMAA